MSSVLDRMYLDDSLNKLSLDSGKIQFLKNSITLPKETEDSHKESFPLVREVIISRLQLEHIRSLFRIQMPEFVNEEQAMADNIKEPCSFYFYGGRCTSTSKSSFYMLCY